ncbi:hypothetical protein HHL16_17020 [Pseudoflavitalea sp. G-6-1-2]|uniref:DUF6683 family protein n=1 Tax=Pseudoflavitalea sp. G-6-1-2 TaxID=2728841 RepID=UPI00146F6C61|nr:DUF6683 family protein [Pseudoflavitalea sp. G-6-1-2]NML22587.1 hypothetical protein [Pseudoflavitalea sp. G-6-1-2]
MKNTMLYQRLIASVLIVISACSGAGAQIGNPGLMYQGAFDNAMFLTTKAAIEKSVAKNKPVAAEKKNPTTSATNNATLNFTSSPEVHKKVLQLIAGIAAKGDKAKQEKHASVLENAALLTQFDKLLADFGYNSHNLSDVFAAYTIIAWQIATGNDAAQYTQGISLFRKQMAQTMSGNKAVTALSSDQKQEMGETLAYISMIFRIAVQNQANENNAAVLNNIRNSMQSLTLRATGLDLMKYTFNNEGFSLKQ